MKKTDGWLAVSTAVLAPRAKLRIVAGATLPNAQAHVKDTEAPNPALTPWQRTSTTIVAEDVNPRTGAAILPKNYIGDDDLPRVTGWKRILRELAKDTGCRDTAFVSDFLLDVEFQHHRSTNGRMHTGLNRWERYAVRSVEDWRKSGINDETRDHAPVRVSERTFRNLKDKLTSAGLIEASTHLWQGITRLWVRPTDELSRMLFEVGYWQSLQQKPAPAVKATKRKPRGISAKHAEIDAKSMDLYRKATAGQMNHLSKDMRWVLWDRLTKPVPLTDAGLMKAPFAPEGSYRRTRLYDGLGLAYG